MEFSDASLLNKYREKVIFAFLDIDTRTQALCRHILFDLKHLPAWAFDGKESIVEEKGKVLHVLKHFSVSMGLSPTETIHCPGAVAATSATIDLVKEINQAKGSFKKILSEIRQQLGGEDTRAFVHDTLEHSGFRGIKLLQVIRLISFIEIHPRRIAWTLVKHTASKTKTTSELSLDLQALGHGKNLDIQQKKLTALGKNTLLVIHREIKDVWQYNITSFKQGKTSNFFGGRSSLPLFYLHDASLPNPVVTLSKKPPKTRKPRIDKKIEDQATISSLHAYRKKVPLK